MTKSDLSLGFVGLGALGLPMAINLHRAGFQLRVHSRSRTAETSPELEGAVRCSSPADASTGVDVLLLCVSNDAAVEDVLFGPCLLYTSPSPRDGLLSRMPSSA